MPTAWQARWDCATKGHWTHTLFSNLRKWVVQCHGQVDLYLTKVLGGHGCFHQYLKNFGHGGDDWFQECGSSIDEDAQHVVFKCRRFCMKAIPTGDNGELLSLTREFCRRFVEALGYHNILCGCNNEQAQLHQGREWSVAGEATLHPNLVESLQNHLIQKHGRSMRFFMHTC